MTEVTLERGVVPRVAEHPTVVAHAAQRKELADALTAAQTELARTTINRVEARRRYETLSGAVARGELTPEAPEWLTAKDEFAALDQQHGAVSLQVDRLRKSLDDCHVAAGVIHAAATREREHQATQQAIAVAAEMLKLVDRLMVLNVELTAYTKVVRSIGRAPIPLDPKLLRGFIRQLGGAPTKQP